MLFESIPLPAVWSIVRRLPAFLLKRHYTASKIERLIYVDLRPRHGAATIDLGEVASFSIYLQIINLSPFDLELDRASFRLRLGGTTVNTSVLKKQVIIAGEIASIYLNEAINDGQANQFSRSFGHGNPIGLEGNIEFNCKVRSFSKNVGHLDGINPTIHNINHRLPKS